MVMVVTLHGRRTDRELALYFLVFGPGTAIGLKEWGGWWFTPYRLLHRLEREGLIEGYDVEDSNAVRYHRPKRMYRLSASSIG